MPSRTDAQLLHLDLLRFLAASGVVVAHAARFLSDETRAALGPVGGATILVDLFFVISGFVIAYVYAGRLECGRDYALFLRRRVARLAPLHWATLTVFVLLGSLVWSGVVPTDHGAQYDPACLIPNLLAVHAWGMCDALSFNDVSWSISAEWAMYLVAPLLIAAARRSVGRLAALIVVTIAMLSLAPDQPWLAWTWQGGALRALPSFATGVVLAEMRATIARHIPAPRRVAFAAGLLAVIGIHAGWPLLVLLPIAYLLVVGTLAADLRGRPMSARLGALGQLSYAIYMLHPLVLTVLLGGIGRRLLHLEGAAADMAVIVALLVTVSLAHLVFHHVETPARRFLNDGARRMRRAG